MFSLRHLPLPSSSELEWALGQQAKARGSHYGRLNQGSLCKVRTPEEQRVVEVGKTVLQREKVVMAVSALTLRRLCLLEFLTTSSHLLDMKLRFTLCWQPNS